MCCMKTTGSPPFFSGIVMRAKRERAWKSPHARKGDTRRGERVPPFLAWGDFHARSRLARSAIPEEKWGTTRSLCCMCRVVVECLLNVLLFWTSRYSRFRRILSTLVLLPPISTGCRPKAGLPQAECLLVPIYTSGWREVSWPEQSFLSKVVFTLYNIAFAPAHLRTVISARFL